MVNEVLSLIHNRNGLVLYEVPEIPSHVQISIRAPGLVPLLALLPNSLDDIALAHSLILHVHELCAKVSGKTSCLYIDIKHFSTPTFKNLLFFSQDF